MMRLTCAQSRARLAPDRSGNLTVSERDALARHLGGCLACQSLAQEWVTLRDAVQAGVPHLPSDTSREATWRMILAETPAQSFVGGNFDMAEADQSPRPVQGDRAPTRPMRLTPTRWLAGIVAALVVAGLIATLANAHHHSSSLSQSAPKVTGPACPPDAYHPKITQAVTIAGMSMVSPTDGWAVGGWQTYGGAVSAGVILHLVNGQWTPISQTFPNIFWESVAMTSASAGWATGTINPQSASPQHILARYDGATWQIQPNPSNLRANAWLVKMYAATDGWLMPRDVSGPGKIELWHYNGVAWSAVPTPFSSQNSVFDVLYSMAVVGPAEIWVAGDRVDDSGPSGGQTMILAHYHAGHWDQTAPGMSGAMDSIAFAAPTNGWAAGQDGGPTALLHFDGASWQPWPVPSSFTANYGYVGGATIGPNGDLWLIGSRETNAGQESYLYQQRSPGVWEPFLLPYHLMLQSITFDQAGDIWGIGAILHTRGCAPAMVTEINQGVLLHYAMQRGQWTETVEPAR